MNSYYYQIDSPIGPLHLAANSKALTAIHHSFERLKDWNKNDVIYENKKNIIIEKTILQLIYKGYNDLNYVFNYTLSLMSFIKISSLRLNLWLSPPPNFTPYFCINLKFGAVFLVQQILQDFPLTLSTNFFVVVATPEIKPKKLRATLSLFKIPLAFPFTIATTLPFFIFLPSFVFDLKTTFLSEYLKASLAKFNPPTAQF